MSLSMVYALRGGMGIGYFLPITVTASANKKGGAIKFL
jgi:hypothetical protein